MPPEERDPAYLWDMLDAARSVVEFTREVTLEGYLRNRMLQSAVERQPEILGEAARNISKEFQAAHAEIPWRLIVGQRNVIAHQYGAVQQERLWAVVQVELPTLIASLEDLVPPAPTDSDQ